MSIFAAIPFFKITIKQLGILLDSEWQLIILHVYKYYIWEGDSQIPNGNISDYHSLRM